VTGPTDPDDPAQIQAEIEATRARLDVPARAREKVARAKDTAVETYRESPPVVISAGLALAGLVLGLVILRKRRATRRTSGATTRRKR
jgi:hypothetical protein